MAFDTTTGLALELRHIKKSYGPVEVLHDISLAMADGEFLVLVGPSGCGKSTLLNCIAGLEEITSGQLSIGGREVTQAPPKDRDIAMVFQSYALYPTMTVGENIGFGMKIRKTAKPAMEQGIRAVAQTLQIDHLLDRKPSALSGGQRQRVAMGRALVRDPKLFLFDEPLSNLDTKLRVEMRAEIKRLHQRTGASIVYVTHDQTEAMTLATRIVVLKGGYVQQIGTPSEIYHQPANRFVADFMGAPSMNLIPAALDQGAIVAGVDRLLWPRTGAETSGHSLGPVILGLRPEHFAPAHAGRGICVTPDLVENTGADTFVSFVWNDTPVTARLPGHVLPETGAPLWLGVDLGRACLFDAKTGVRLTMSPG